jgi:hypothetical protein
MHFSATSTKPTAVPPLSAQQPSRPARETPKNIWCNVPLIASRVSKRVSRNAMPISVMKDRPLVGDSYRSMTCRFPRHVCSRHWKAPIRREDSGVLEGRTERWAQKSLRLSLLFHIIHRGNKRVKFHRNQSARLQSPMKKISDLFTDAVFTFGNNQTPQET